MADISEQVCKQCRTSRRNVEAIVNTLCGGHHLIKEHVDNQYLVCRYRLKDTTAGFGVSQQMATLNDLLKAARGESCAALNPSGREWKTTPYTTPSPAARNLKQSPQQVR